VAVAVQAGGGDRLEIQSGVGGMKERTISEQVREGFGLV
jgi:hypothetical protein